MNNKSAEDKYIYPSWDKYVIRKRIQGKMKYYGIFTTLDEARGYRDFLEEHCWNPKYIKKNNNPNKNIKKHRKKYSLIKKINGKEVYFGLFDTLQEAREYRDFLEKHNWNQKYRKIQHHNFQWNKYNLPKNIHYNKQQNTYNVRKVFNYKQVHFGTYHSLEEAVHERDFYQSIDWDFDLLDLY